MPGVAAMPAPCFWLQSMSQLPARRRAPASRIRGTWRPLRGAHTDVCYQRHYVAHRARRRRRRQQGYVALAFCINCHRPAGAAAASQTTKAAGIGNTLLSLQRAQRPPLDCQWEGRFVRRREVVQPFWRHLDGKMSGHPPSTPRRTRHNHRKAVRQRRRSMVGGAK